MDVAKNGPGKMRRPPAVSILIVTDIVFAVIGFGSAFALLLSPSGAGIGLSRDLLKNAPVGDFFFLGLYLLVFFGILPSMAAYGLLTRNRWPWTDMLNRWTGHYWGWTAAVAVGILLLIWILIELVIVGFLTGIGATLQITMTAVGVWILGLTMLPSVRLSMRLED